MLEKIMEAVVGWINGFLFPDPSIEFMRLPYSSRAALQIYEEALTHHSGNVPFYRDGKWWIITKVTAEDDYVIVRGTEFIDED